MRHCKRYLPLLILICLITAFFAFGLEQYFTFEMLKNHRQELLHLVESYFVFASLIYMLVYIAIVALSVPGGAVMTITGGFMFGMALGTLYVVFAATIGATILFIIAKTSLGDPLRDKAGPWLDKLAKGFQKDAFSYLLFLRLIPLFPFFAVNLAPAFLGVKTRTYIIATFIGIIPGTFVFSSVGSGIGSVFDSGETFDPAGILTIEVWIALVGLAVLSIAPVVYKKIKGKR